ncbi:OTU deubiquitinase with linear linkage specificity a [Corythoichthys intestinalis]|uniref:OTU deubiquitinase with linear linkage specificity a n=1 Tax=Corythoichthys intestinalis TaxID=161448 RepID=UPI0025A59E10|nr:OTU deubiquitinase with linear linkage specificity a [Corythoichthys intestinalis]XP_061809994.1 protein YAE1 homolog [Nerophis lumbriciformis]
MSWFKAASNGVGDVFEENADELGISSKEWANNMKRRIRDGYVDGADAGEDAALEVGFKEGFLEGAAKTVAVGRLRGIVCAIGSWYQVEHQGEPFPDSVTDLLQRVSLHEDSIVTEIMKVMEKLPPPSVDNVLESMEELEVVCPPGGCQKSNCCKAEEQMDNESAQCSASGDSSSPDCGAPFSELVQRCRDIVSEFGLPQELMEHINELENI